MDWVGKNGVDKAKFLDAWNSFGVMTKLKRLPQILNAYKVDSVPTLVIDGRLMTSPSMVGATIRAWMKRRCRRRPSRRWTTS